MLFGNADQISIWIISLTLSLSLIIGILSCVCAFCRKKIPKNELLGLAGLVKITNPDENVNFNSTQNIQLNSFQVVHEDHLKSPDLNSNKRGSSSSTANATRSLPDLPVDSTDLPDKPWTNTENNIDTNSDLYATVEDGNRKKRRGGGGGGGLEEEEGAGERRLEAAERREAGGGTGATAGDSGTHLDSLSPYARLKGEHSYDQLLEQNEHAYAQVGPLSNGPLSPAAAQCPASSSTIPSRGADGEPPGCRKSSPAGGGECSSGGAECRDTSSGAGGGGAGGGGGLAEVQEMIPAASAIAGSVPASVELPYMTPPLQQHFSGDSQDSAKGYTSISVREPLSQILGERGRTGVGAAGAGGGGGTAPGGGGEGGGCRGEGTGSSHHRDPHYATVSDDSGDEMYAAIEERNTSGSETYAQISPPPQQHVLLLPTPACSSTALPPPPPPLTLTLHQHNLEGRSDESPRRERRPADSPLPQVPHLDEMYAKVMKKRSPDLSPTGPPSPPTPPPPTTSTSSNSGGPVAQSVGPTPLSDPMYQSVSGGSCPSHHDPRYQSIELSEEEQPLSDPNYEELQEHDYASLNRRYEPVDPNYESVESHDPPYDRVEAPDYETVLRLGEDELSPRVLELYARVNKSPERSERL